MKSETIENCKKCKIGFAQERHTYQLIDFLYDMKKDELNEIRKVLNIKGISKLKKDDLIEYLEKYIYNNLQDIIEKSLNKEEIVFLTKLIKNNGVLDYDDNILQYSIKLNKVGLAFFTSIEDGKKIVVVPSNMKEKIRKIVLQNEVKDELIDKEQWEDILKALLYYYGVIYVEDAHRITEKLCGKSIGFYDYVESVASRENEIYTYSKLSKIIYLKEVLNPDYIFREQKARKVDYYPITKDMVKQANNNEYTDVQNKFLNMIIKNYNVDYKKAKQILDVYIKRIKNGYTFEQSMTNLFPFLNIKDKDSMKDFLSNLVYLYNNTNMWALKGYTPEQFTKVHKVKGTTIVNKNKIGRNEPCPCGSGKKYKNCCGK